MEFRHITYILEWDHPRTIPVKLNASEMKMLKVSRQTDAR